MKLSPAQQKALRKIATGGVTTFTDTKLKTSVSHQIASSTFWVLLAAGLLSQARKDGHYCQTNVSLSDLGKQVLAELDKEAGLQCH